MIVRAKSYNTLVAQISLKETLSHLSDTGKFEDFNVATVVLWHVHLEPAIAVKVCGFKYRNYAACLNDSVLLILELRGVSCWSEDMSLVVSTACNKDMGAFSLRLPVWIDSVRETWRT